MQVGASRAREARQPVKIGARLKSDAGWSDVVIANVSSRGVMGLCVTPPARGDYIEVRCGNYTIIARVAWAREGRFGARSQNRIELRELMAGSRGRVAAAGERRQLERPAKLRPRHDLAEQGARSARVSRAMNFVSIAFAGAAFAAIVAGAAYQALSQPFDSVGQVLASAGESPPSTTELRSGNLR